MSGYEVLIKMSLDNFESEKEVLEAINSIFSDGIEPFRKNYGEPLNKKAIIEDISTSVVVPPFAQIDKVTMAKLVTQFMSVEDRQLGVYKSRGSKSLGAFFVIDRVLTPALKKLHVAHLFEMYNRGGSAQVLVQDILGNIVINFEEVPSMLMDVADFAMKLVEHYKAHEDELSPYLAAEPAGTTQEVAATGDVAAG